MIISVSEAFLPPFTRIVSRLIFCGEIDEFELFRVWKEISITPESSSEQELKILAERSKKVINFNLIIKKPSTLDSVISLLNNK